MRDILISLRPRQWIKNIAIFAALIFSHNFFQLPKFLLVLTAALIFTVLSGSIYLINDACDVEFDKKHPRKRFRPIASGRISVGSAHALAAALLFFSLALSFFLNRDFFFILAIYAVIEVLYSVYLKDVVILDVFCIASGFLLRVLAGAVVLDVPVSDWLLICTIFLSLFLALSKRRSEMVLLKDAACEHRRVLSEYSIGFIDQMVTIVTASTIFSYVLYAFSPETLEKFHTKNLCYTIIFVVYGIFRYLYLVYQKQEGHTPENVFFTDKPFLLNILLYAASVVAIIYVR